MISFEQVSKRFPDGTTAVDDLTLEAPRGRTTVLLGPSGCGKSTTLRMVNRLVDPTSGTVTLDGRDVRSLPPHVLRRGIGYVIQQGGLFPHRTVLDNIGTVPELLGWPPARRRSRAHELLDLVGLEQSVAGRYPRELSGGQQQRVGVARALAASPPVLLMDEPFGAVDPVRRAALQREFRQLQQRLGTTVIFVTHDVEEAVLLADHIAVMRPGGVLAQHGPTERLLARPVDGFVAGFLGRGRGHMLLALQSASVVRTDAASVLEVAGWILELDAQRHPVRWRNGSSDSDLATVSVQTVAPDGSLRELLDSALSSPARAAVRVTTTGALDGVVPWPVLEQHLGVPDRTNATGFSR